MVSSSLIERHLGQRRCLPMYCTTYGGLRTRGRRKEGGRRLPFHGEERERERRSHFTGKEALCVGGGGRGGDEIGHVRLAPVQNGGTRVRYDAWQEGGNMWASTTLHFPGNMRIFLINAEKVRVLFPLRFPPFFSR